MGGMIFVGLRFKDENNTPKEVLMMRWTNDLPWRSCMPSFLDQGKEFHEFIDEAKPGATEYGDTELLDRVMQSEYGVVLFDFIKHKIYVRGHYYSPDRIMVTELSSAFAYEIGGIVELIRRGYVEVIRDLDWNAIYVDDPGHPYLRERIIGKIRFNLVNQKYTRTHIFLDVHFSKERYPFTIDAKLDLPTYKQVKNWLKKNGWTSEVDEASFKEYQEDTWA